MNVAGVLYLKCVPGLCGTGCARKAFGVILSAADEVSSWCPADIVSRSRMRIDFRLADGSGGASSGKILRISSSRLRLPSAIAKPTETVVKLLLSETSQVMTV